jgi:molybdopterin molybdotransferase
MIVNRVSVRPGKPTWFGTAPPGLVLGLPGNPASALVCAQLFLKPLMERMLGRIGEPVFQFARLANALSANGPREHYMRAMLRNDETGQATVQAFADQDSSLLSVFASANALLRLPPDSPSLGTGERVRVLPLDLA